MLTPLLAHASLVILYLAIGTYLTAVADAMTMPAAPGVRARQWHTRPAWGRSIPETLARALARPWRSAALELLTSRVTAHRPDAPVWALAPALLGGVAAAALAAVPLGVAVPSGIGVPYVSSGIVLFGAAMALVMVAVYLNGWAANSPFSLIGGYRFVAQALSYEMPLALVLIAAALPARSLSVQAIVASQAGVWNLLRQPLGLPVYLIAGMGLAFWGPLATPDAPDVADGTASELSGVALVLWRAGRAAVLVAVAAMGAAAFLGGPVGPFGRGATGAAVVWMALKTMTLLVVMIWSGNRLARVRVEWFVRFAWVVLIPVALVDVFASGALVLLTG